MNKMKVLSLVTSFLLATSILSPTVGFAEKNPTPTKINSDTTTENSSSVTQEELINVMNSLTEDLEVSTDQKVYTYSNTGKLSDGSDVTLEVTDMEIIETPSIQPRGPQTISYGSRTYEAVFYKHANNYPDPQLVLNFTYKAGDFGLKAETASQAGTKGVWPYVVTTNGYDIYDKEATQVGHDINAQGNYTISGIATGFPLISGSYSLVATVKLNSINKTTKMANVINSFTVKEGL